MGNCYRRPRPSLPVITEQLGPIPPVDDHPLMLVMNNEVSRHSQPTRRRQFFLRFRHDRQPSQTPTWAFCPLTEEELDKHVLGTLSVLHNSAETNDTTLILRMRMFKFWANGDKGWSMVLKSLVRAVPVDDALSASAITLFMDHCPLPTPKAVLSFISDINLSKETAQLEFGDIEKRKNQKICRRRNVCAVLGHLAETLAGGLSNSMLNDHLLEYLLVGLNKSVGKFSVDANSILYSLIALEKFALAGDNKRKIANTDITEKLMKLENWANSKDCRKRQVGFSARWLLDNIFISKDRTLSYKTVKLDNINAMLNVNDVSEYLKISPDGLEARSDASSFESVRCTFSVDSGVWYYEVTIVTVGVMQIGWATKKSKFFNYDGFGIGDDEFSCAYDGCRQLLWHLATSHRHSHRPWQEGDVLGLLLDLERSEVIFYMNGVSLPPEKEVFRHAKGGFFAAASFMSHQQCLFNFGASPFKFPPKDRQFSTFNQFAYLSADEKIILPRHKKMELLDQSKLLDDACTICCDLPIDTTFMPCGHGDICHKCALLLDSCHLCRAEIVARNQMTTFKNKSDTTITSTSSNLKIDEETDENNVLLTILSNDI